jgi:hypothetical protein
MKRRPHEALAWRKLFSTFVAVSLLLQVTVIASIARESTTISTLAGGVRLGMDLPTGEDFDPNRPTVLIVYATPNGSTIEQTLGGKAAEGAGKLDWRFDLQHIAAQTRRLREVDRRENVALAVVQPAEKSWPAFRKAHADAPQRERAIVEAAARRVPRKLSAIELTGHSGGGSFLFGYLDAAGTIPADVRRIAFLDANYSYSDDARHGDKLLAWLRGDAGRTLVVIAYDDREITLDGKKVVGPTGGTFRASHRMLDRFGKNLKFIQGTLGPFDTFEAMSGQVRFFIHPNRQNQILHSALVGDMNGFLEAMTVGTPEAGQWGTFGGPRAYTQSIRPIPPRRFPDRPSDAIGGAALMDQVAPLSLDEREARIAEEIVRGNFPAFLRQFKTITITAILADGKPHTIELRVMPDYLSVGSDADFVRVPLTPRTAMRIADAFGCVLPTQKIVDEIYEQAELKLEPRPLTEQREAVATFVQHNRVIVEQRAGRAPGALIAGLKKDVVLSNRLSEKPGRVAIYGWHTPDGKPIQPLTIVHIDRYVDYSHGIRFVCREVTVDGKPMDIADVLKDREWCALLSDEGPMEIGRMYALLPATAPATQP